MRNTSLLYPRVFFAAVRALGLLGVLFWLLLITKTVLAQSAPQVTPHILAQKANEARLAQRLPILDTSPALEAAAQAKARDMFQKQYFEHNAPNGATPWSFIRGANYDYVWAGENLAVDFTNDAAVQAAWMVSETHRANILNPHFSQIGVAAVAGRLYDRDTTVVVEMFGAPRPAVEQFFQTVFAG